jgi:hypothetical protein
MANRAIVFWRNFESILNRMIGQKAEIRAAEIIAEANCGSYLPPRVGHEEGAFDVYAYPCRSAKIW